MYCAALGEIIIMRTSLAPASGKKSPMNHYNHFPRNRQPAGGIPQGLAGARIPLAVGENARPAVGGLYVKRPVRAGTGPAPGLQGLRRETVTPPPGVRSTAMTTSAFWKSSAGGAGRAPWAGGL